MTSKRLSTSTSKKSSPDECHQFAKYQSMLLLLMIIFVGITCLPAMLEQLSSKRKTATVEKVHYSDGTVSIVDIQVGQQSFGKRRIEKQLNENDVVTVYISKNNHLYFQKPNKICLWMVIIYFLLLSLSLGFTIYLLVRY